MGFLSEDECLGLEHLLADARHEAVVDERAGRNEWAMARYAWIADVAGILERHRAMVRAERDLPVGGGS